MSESLDKEAMRVIKSMPNWKPGTQRGKAVRVQYNLPIKFTLDSDDDKKKEEDKKKIEAQKKYEKGLINALELFTAKNLFANAQNENLQVRLRTEINNSTLDFYRGLPVFNIN